MNEEVYARESAVALALVVLSVIPKGNLLLPLQALFHPNP